MALTLPLNCDALQSMSAWLMSSTSVILNIIVYQEHVVEENVKIQNTDQTNDHIPQTYTAVGKYSNRQNRL